MSRYVIARPSGIDRGRYTYVPVLDLPPGTWRVTVHDDGTIERVAMRQHGWFDGGHHIVDVGDNGPLPTDLPAWVDAPADPEDGGNETQWREDDVADSYEDDPEDGAR